MKRLTIFLHHSFCDARGVPDGKLLTLAAVALVVVATYPVGWSTGVWPPEYIHAPTLLFLAAGLGLDAYVTRAQIRATAAVAQATATGLPVPEEAPEVAVVATTTTVAAAGEAPTPGLSSGS
jgi:hypothetical protein